MSTSTKENDPETTSTSTPASTPAPTSNSHEENNMGKKKEIKKCDCQWNECSKFQESLMKHNHILGGCIDIRIRVARDRGKEGLSNKKEAFKQSCIKHLKFIPNRERWTIAKHHFPIQVIKDYNDNVQSLNQLIPKCHAAIYGYKEGFEVYPHNASRRDVRTYGEEMKYCVRAPIVPKNQVKLLIQSLESRRGTSKRNRSLHEDDDKAIAAKLLLETTLHNNARKKQKLEKAKTETATKTSKSSSIFSKLSVSEVETIQDLIAPKEKIQEILSYRWNTVHKADEKAFVDDLLVQKIHALMKFVFEDLEKIPIQTKEEGHPNKYLYFCETIDCPGIFTRVSTKANISFCDECQRLRKNARDRRERKEKREQKEGRGSGGGGTSSGVDYPEDANILWNGKPTKQSYYDNANQTSVPTKNKEDLPTSPHNHQWRTPNFKKGFHPMMMMGGNNRSMPPPMNRPPFPPFTHRFPPQMPMNVQRNMMMMNHSRFRNANEQNPNQVGNNDEKQNLSPNENSDDAGKTQNKQVHLVDPSIVENEDSGTPENHADVSGTDDAVRTNTQQTTTCNQTENVTNSDKNKNDCRGNDIAIDTMENGSSEKPKTQSSSSTNIQNNMEKDRYHPMMMMGGNNGGMPPPMNRPSFPPFMHRYPPQMPMNLQYNMMMMNHSRFHNANERNLKQVGNNDGNQDLLPNENNDDVEKTQNMQVHLVDPSQINNDSNNTTSNAQTGGSTNPTQTDDKNKTKESNYLVLENEDGGTLENHTNGSDNNVNVNTNTQHATTCTQTATNDETSTNNNRGNNISIDTVENGTSDKQKIQSSSSTNFQNNIEKGGYHPMMMMGGTPGGGGNMPHRQHWMPHPNMQSFPPFMRRYPPPMPIGGHYNMMNNNDIGANGRNPNPQSPKNHEHLIDPSQNKTNMNSNKQTSIDINQSTSTTINVAREPGTMDNPNKVVVAVEGGDNDTGQDTQSSQS